MTSASTTTKRYGKKKRPETKKEITGKEEAAAMVAPTVNGLVAHGLEREAHEVDKQAAEGNTWFQVLKQLFVYLTYLG